MSNYQYRSPLNDAICTPDKKPNCPWNPKIDRSKSIHTKQDWRKTNEKILPDILAAVGNTPLVKLNKIPPKEGLKCDVFVKCEYFNPGGSVKDRMALRILEDAEKSGILKPGGTIIEPSSGNTGIGLALASAIKGYRCIICISEKISKEKEYVMNALGAEVIRCSVSASSFSPEGLFGTVHRLSKEIPGAVIFDQFSNPGNPLTHYDTTAEEIFDQCDGKVDMIVMGAGTGGTVTGIGRKFKEISPQTKIICADPIGSSFALPESINKTDVTFWEIEGMGYEFIPTVLDRNVIDQWIKVGDKDALPMARRLIKDEGLLIGASSGAMMWAAVQAAKDLKKGQRVVVVLPDSIRNYLTKFACDQWMEERGLKPAVNVNNHSWWDKNVSALELFVSQTLPQNSTYENAFDAMKNLKVDQLPVLGENGGVDGVVSMQIIVNKLVSRKAKLSDKVSDSLDRLFPRVEKTANVGLVARILEREHYVIVVDTQGSGPSKMKILKLLPISRYNIVLNNRVSSSSFQDAMKYPMKLGQVLSYFPINLRHANESLKFRWLYWRVAYSLITFVLFSIEFVFVVIDAFRTTIDLLNIKVIVFHLGALVQFVIFFRLTYNWPSFVKEWAKVEFHMKCYEITGNLRFKLACLVTGLMFIAGVEHGLVNAYKIKSRFDEEPSYSEAFKAFFTQTYTHIFNVMEYSFWLGLLIQFTNLQRTFYWNYNDVFIMLIGSALTFKMKQMSKKIKDSSKIKVRHLQVWKTIRQDYARLSELCHLVNERISGAIITSFLLNLYFVILQLHSSLRPIESVVEKVYFYLSFGLLLLRIFCMCTFGGAVYEEWINIRYYLNNIGTAAYNFEVDRLINHVVSWELSLTGKKFFSITRGLILQMAGAIVTYELFLIQFYKNLNA